MLLVPSDEPEQTRVLAVEIALDLRTALLSSTSPTHALALLPGSRPQELEHHWPLMLATYRRLKKLLPQLTGVKTPMYLSPVCNRET